MPPFENSIVSNMLDSMPSIGDLTFTCEDMQINYEPKMIYHNAIKTNNITSDCASIKHITMPPQFIFVHLVKEIINNPPATIVKWKDGTKTVVKCAKDDEYNEYYGFCCALAKKMYGNNSKIKKIIREHSHTQIKKEKK